MLTIFFIQNPKGGPFYTCRNAFRMGPFLGSKIELMNLLMPKLGAKIIYFCQNMHFHQVLFDLIDFNTPIAVTCNEAVNLANRYSDEQGRRMINGVLRKLQKSALILNLK